MNRFIEWLKCSPWWRMWFAIVPFSFLLGAMDAPLQTRQYNLMFVAILLIYYEVTKS